MPGRHWRWRTKCRPCCKAPARTGTERPTLPEGLSSTIFCVQQTEPKPGGPDLMWVTAALDTPRSAWRVHLDQGGSFYRIAMDPWDEALVDLEEGEGGWLRPYALVLPLEGAAALAARATRPEPGP